MCPPYLLSLWSHFERLYKWSPRGNLWYAVRGFFQNGGRFCYVVPLEDDSDWAFDDALKSLEELNTVDLICAPELIRKREQAPNSSVPETPADAVFVRQQELVDHCGKMGDRFAILDSLPPGTDPNSEDRRRAKDQWSAIVGADGALYYPWIKVYGAGREVVEVPPCGHIAGVYARTDQDYGVHKAPANEILEGVVDLTDHLNNGDHLENGGQGQLNEAGVNCLRVFPARGIRVWGARTLSGHQDWSYVSVRRTFLTAVRWIEWNMTDVVFENNDARLWGRIERELNTYFVKQFRAGALKGRTPQEAFYVKCNEETNPPEIRDLGRVQAEIGLAPSDPLEFVVVRLFYGESGVKITGPHRPNQN